MKIIHPFLWIIVLGWATNLSAADNIVLFVTDDESPTLGCYGDSIAKTPNVDAMAAEGVTFTNAMATTASCSASRSVILTGLHNHANGQYGHQHHFHKFNTYHDVISLSLPFVLSQHGYRTARIGKFHVGPEKVYPFETKLEANVRNPVQMADACKNFISSKNDDRPFFLYFATSDPHRSGAVNRRSQSDFKPNLFGNKPNRAPHFDVDEVYYEPQQMVVPPFLPNTKACREELAQYYQSVARVDQGLGRLIKILKEANLYENTLILFTSDHGMAFPGAKTNVYEPALHVPLVVKPTSENRRGVLCEALVSHTDITPTLVDFAGALDKDRDGPANWVNPNHFWQSRNEDVHDNRAGGNVFRSYHGKSWLGLLQDESGVHREEVFASHTFHEIQMYYPMRALRDRRYKLIWNIAHKLEFPFATDLLESSTWQTQLKKGVNANYASRSIREYLKRPEFEFYDLKNDPNESKNLTSQPGYAEKLEEYKRRIRRFQSETN
ncbi:MAG: sulfatase [Planctomycetota bacterium]